MRDARGRVGGGRLALKEKAEIPKEPVFPRMPNLDQWLRDNLGGSGYFEEDIRRSDPEPWIMRAVIRSIRSRTCLRIAYHSRSGEGKRLVSPHAIIRIAGRMHMRAYDHSINEYRDFVLSRITEATLIVDGSEYVNSKQDLSWFRFKTVVIEDKGVESGANLRLGVRLDFGLDQRGRRAVRAREPLLDYLIDNMSEGHSNPVHVYELKKIDNSIES